MPPPVALLRGRNLCASILGVVTTLSPKATVKPDGNRGGGQTLLKYEPIVVNPPVSYTGTPVRLLDGCFPAGECTSIGDTGNRTIFIFLLFGGYGYLAFCSACPGPYFYEVHVLGEAVCLY